MDSQIKKLCKRAQRAEKNAACELLQIFYADIYAYLRRLCGCNQDAEDLTQQTFLKVWSSLDGFAGRSKFSTWLHRVAYNTFIDWQRSNNDSAQSCLDLWWQECMDTTPGPLETVAEQQLNRRLYEAVACLDEDKKQEL